MGHVTVSVPRKEVDCQRGKRGKKRERNGESKESVGNDGRYRGGEWRGIKVISLF